MPEQFVGEAIRPAGGFLPTGGARVGGPALPAGFVWRGRRYGVAEVLRRWKTTSPCHSGSREQYVRKHCFLIRTSDGVEMRIYFERQARSSRQARSRWWLHTVRTPEEG